MAGSAARKTRQASVTKTGPKSRKRPPVSAPVASDAYALGPRARAILRGREAAAQDLREAGGAFTLDEVCRLLNGVTRQRVDQMVKEGRLLAVPGPSNRRRYPAIQFSQDGKLVEGLKEVQSALPTQNPWIVLNFLIHPDDRLQGLRPVELLREGSVERVVLAAKNMAEMGA